MKEILSPSDKDDTFPGKNLLSIKGIGEKWLAPLEIDF